MKAKWVAKDESGLWYSYESKPARIEDSWIGREPKRLEVRDGFPLSGVSWKKSLVRIEVWEELSGTIVIHLDKTDPIEFDWSGISNKYHWAAMDASEEWYIYSEEPKVAGNEWWAIAGNWDLTVHTKGKTSLPWNETVIQRDAF